MSVPGKLWVARLLGFARPLPPTRGNFEIPLRKTLYQLHIFFLFES